MQQYQYLWGSQPCVTATAPFLVSNSHCRCCHCRAETADKAMQDVFGAEYVSLHVRVSNKGAIHLYTQTLGYE